MIVPCPDGWTLEGWTPSTTQSKELNTKDYNIPQMVKNTYLLGISSYVYLCECSRNYDGLCHFTNRSETDWFKCDSAALCVSLMTLFNMFGRISFGFIYDKLKGWNSLILVLLINGISMLMLTMLLILYAYFILCIALVGFSFLVDYLSYLHLWLRSSWF